MATVLKNLQKAREIITPPDRWIRWSRWESHEDGGHAHCALGALEAARTGKEYDMVHSCTPEVVALALVITDDEWDKVCKHPKNNGEWGKASPLDARVAGYNNLNDHKSVLALFDRAIEIQKEHPTEKV